MKQHTCNWKPDTEWDRDEKNECVHGVYRSGGPCPICDCPACKTRLTANQEADAVIDHCDYTDHETGGCRVIYRDDLDTGRSYYQVVDALGHGDGSGEWTEVC